MEDLVLLLIVMGFVFTLFAIFGDNRKLIASMLSFIIWFPVTAAVAADATVAHFWTLFFGLGWFMFAWTAICAVEHLTGRALISKGEEE